ncbi:hypothetical protein [Vibrio sp. EA2]|uniref:hypothetical protein n=1 Tax=Vibrio sp. EA2 TaxID=3079860 RepID=UPI0029497AC4|nr:hypothetical protein [Vibrio sp. EA2]MDV6254003.1 hypothetical protein [Vibrio sp. EA2]
MAINFDWVYKSQFEAWSENSAYWHDKSTSLMHASEILWKSYENGELIDGGNSHRLLMGLSFELMFKAFYVAESEEPPTHHDLNNLTKHCKLQLSKKDRVILEVLHGYILWQGRYPTPKKPKTKKSKTEPDYKGIKDQSDPFVNTLPIESQLDGNSNQLLKIRDLDFEHLFNLWKKINNEYLDKYLT